jgi:hypothetical protein
MSDSKQCPNPPLKGMYKRLCLTPDIKRSPLTVLQASRGLGLHLGTLDSNLYGVLGLAGRRTCSSSY